MNSSPEVVPLSHFVIFWGSPLFSTNQAESIVYAWVLIPVKKYVSWGSLRELCSGDALVGRDAF